MSFDVIQTEREIYTTPTIYITHTNDVVCFTQVWDNDEFIQEISKEYFGLDDFKKMNQLAKDEDYITILKHLWTEKDHAKKLAWLRSLENEAHPILLFEQAIEEIYAAPSFLSVPKINFILMKGLFRAAQDARCFQDTSIYSALGFLQSVYGRRTAITYQNAAEKKEKGFLKFISAFFHLFISRETLIQRSLQFNYPINGGKSIKQMEAFAQAMSEKKQHFPSPNWVQNHGLAVMMTGSSETVDEQDYNPKRVNVSKELIEMEKKELNEVRIVAFIAISLLLLTASVTIITAFFASRFVYRRFL